MQRDSQFVISWHFADEIFPLRNDSPSPPSDSSIFSPFLFFSSFLPSFFPFCSQLRFRARAKQPRREEILPERESLSRLGLTPSAIQPLRASVPPRVHCTLSSWYLNLSTVCNCGERRPTVPCNNISRTNICVSFLSLSRSRQY